MPVFKSNFLLLIFEFFIICDINPYQIYGLQILPTFLKLPVSPVSCFFFCAEDIQFDVVPLGFPGSSAGKESACSAGDPGSSPGQVEAHIEKG